MDRLRLLLLVVACFTQVVYSEDKTRQSGASGSEVVEATLNVIRAARIFDDDDKLFFRRLAYVESVDGTSSKTFRSGYYGGIWQVDPNMFSYVSGYRSLSVSRILTKLKIRWSSVKWQDLKMPLYSALAARLFVERRTNKPIPLSITDQANYYRSYYRSNGNPSTFIQNANKLGNGCKSIRGVDLVFVLDASGSIGSTNFLTIKKFVKNVVGAFDISSDKTRVGIIKYATSVYREFTLHQYRDKNSVMRAVDRIRYTGGGTNTYYGIDWMVRYFTSTAYGSRPKSSGVPRVAIVLTDGRSASSSRTIQSAQRAHSQDITMFAIGVGSVRNLNMPELDSIATDPNSMHKFLIDFKDFDSLKNAIEKRTCEVPVPIAPGNDIDEKLPPKALQYCKLNVPRGGLTIKIKSKDSGIVKFYTSREAFPNGAIFQSVITSSRYSYVSVYITHVGTATYALVYCSLVNQGSQSSDISVITLPGKSDWCSSSPCKNGGKCLDQGKVYSRGTYTAPKFKCQCPSGTSGTYCQTVSDPCFFKPCYNNGVCKRMSLGSSISYRCYCQRGFTGTRCQSRDPCASIPCGRYGSCTRSTASSTGYICRCSSGFTGTRCEKRLNPCASNPCLRGGLCRYASPTTYTCTCPSLYTGIRCEIIKDPCDSSPCLYNGRCKRLSSTSSSYRCYCQAGYIGSRCQQKQNPCDSKPCLYNGVCTPQWSVSPATYKCGCSTWFTGSRCEKRRNPCASSPCVNGQCSVASPTAYRCKCSSWYEGSKCEKKKDPCSTSPCLNGGRCTTTAPTLYKCNCQLGYTGSDCGKEINPCDSHKCVHATACKKINHNTYKCECKDGYKGATCNEEIDPCDANPCSEKGTKSCQREDYQTFNCVCEPGYEGDTCDQEIDPCDANPCSVKGTKSCQREDYQTFNCVCEPGYEGDTCDQEIDPCDANPCSVKGSKSCQREDYQTFNCVCEPGYEGDTCDQEIDPCSTNPCDHGDCKKITYTEYKCDCDGGYMGDKCSTVDYCYNKPCQHGGQCETKETSFLCHCTDKWEGDTCKDKVKESFDCNKNNPCTAENKNFQAGDYYHPHANPHKYVQCSAYEQCFEMWCSGGLVWKDSISTCDWP